MKLTKYQFNVLRLWLHYYHSGYSFDQWMRRSWKALLVLGVLLGISIFLILAGVPVIGWAYLGFFFGTLLRDLTYYRLGRRNWPLLLEIVNWDRAQQLVDAHDKPVTAQK